METLLGVLRTSSSHSMQDMALSALASTVAAAGPDVAPYAHMLLPVLQVGQGRGGQGKGGEGGGGEGRGGEEGDIVPFVDNPNL